ncbi:hypothetical protein A1O3_00770 [Capronia epimyces CBS 606.96]|uniref:Histidine-specific methyltransferase SAM-dependent domain-containing protein n=1 Tax=Capronia epimyces CBS 606.96 TaxID=1182542 RepID=W9YRC0_9EURO|nr:uncharacterized protein A1O3_00770 [Capronia epimyces CBS 606.96]EXJ92220.1 hypothetical protein A1O3_00770 [Capronia epimyces CBS 606.96]
MDDNDTPVRGSDNMVSQPSQNANSYDIIDIGGSKLRDYLLAALQRDFLNKKDPEVPYVSDIFTSSDEGLELWSTITSLPTWYQTREEIDLLRRWGPDIAKHVRPGTSLVDLGSGDVKKITPLLECLEAQEFGVTYYCVDLSRASIAHGLETLSARRYRHITLVGLWGTFDAAKLYLDQIASPRFLASLGAEIGNDTFDSARADLASWAAKMRPGDQLLLGLDGTRDKTKIWKSYHHSDVHRFIRTGMASVNATLPSPWFRDEDWVLDGEIRTYPEEFSHRFFFTALRPVSCPEAGVSFSPGDRFECCESHRKTPAEMRVIFKACGLNEIQFWKSPVGDMYEYLLVLQDEP